MATIADDYVKKHARSMELYRESSDVFPGGVTHDTRFLRPFPVFIERALGCRKWDVDGNEYVCYVMGHGSLILGHTHPAVRDAVCAQMARGTHLGANTEAELRWAQAVRRLMPSMEVVRFHSSGTEATLMAVRLARAFTGKTKILRLAEHFHGWSDCFSVRSDKHSGAGVPEVVGQTVVTLPGGDIAAVARLLEQDRDIAALILEPTGPEMGYAPLMPEFLRDLRQLTAAHGVLLVFDEVVTGFRVSPGGAQVRFGVTPDLTALAKILAGGLPGGCVGGRRDIMELMAIREDAQWNLRRRVAHPGTFNANPLSAAAGVAALGIIASEPVNRTADAAAARLKQGLNRVFAKCRVTGFAYGLASLVWVVFGVSYDGDLEFCALPPEQLKKGQHLAEPFRRAMLNEGVDVMAGTRFIVSASHGDRDIDATVDAFERAVSRMRQEGIVSSSG